MNIYVLKSGVVIHGFCFHERNVEILCEKHRDWRCVPVRHFDFSGPYSTVVTELTEKDPPHWRETNFTGCVCCSVCGYFPPPPQAITCGYTLANNFCPKCGADMRQSLEIERAVKFEGNESLWNMAKKIIEEEKEI